MHSNFSFKSNIFNVIDCKKWEERNLTEMNVPSETTTVYILKHINGFKYHVVKDSHEVP